MATDPTKDILPEVELSSEGRDMWYGISGFISEQMRNAGMDPTPIRDEEGHIDETGHLVIRIVTRAGVIQASIPPEHWRWMDKSHESN